MPNSPVTITWVTNESADRYTNSLAFVDKCNRAYSDEFAKKGGAKVGDTVNVRLPRLFNVRSGQAWNPQNIVDATVPVTLRYQHGVDLDWSSIESTLELDRIRERYINPAADVLASTVDYLAAADVYKSVFSSVGTPGTSPTTNLTWLQAKDKVFTLGGPDNKINALCDVVSSTVLVNANFTVFNPQGDISALWKNGQFGPNKALGMDGWYRTQSMPKHTTGEFTSCTPAVNGASQTGSSIVTDGWASGASSLKAGDTLEFAGCYSVNPLTKQSTGQLAQFVVTADASDTTGDMTISISPSIITSGAYQNVSASPANNAAIYVWNTRSTTYALTATVSPQNMVFHPNAFAHVMVDLDKPIAGADSAFARSEDAGFSIRLVRQYQLAGDQNGTRLDVIHGAAPIQPRLAARVAA